MLIYIIKIVFIVSSILSTWIAQIPGGSTRQMFNFLFYLP